MKRCPACARELVWDGRVLAVLDEATRWDALVGCAGCLAVVCASVKKKLWSTPWPKVETVSLELPGTAATRAIDALRARGRPAFERLADDARTRILLRLPEVADAARATFESRRVRLARNAMLLAWDWQRTLALSQPRRPFTWVPDWKTLAEGRLAGVPARAGAFADVNRLDRARLETLPFRATNQRALMRGESDERRWAIYAMPLPRGLTLAVDERIGSPSVTVAALLAGSELAMRGVDGADVLLRIEASTVRAPLDLVEPTD